MPSIIDRATSSFARDQMSTTLLYFSPWVTSPDAYCDSISFTSDSASPMMVALSSGITKSSTPIEAPDAVE